MADFRANINVEVRVPITVSELIAHYRKHELAEDKKAFATIASTSIYLTNHIAPEWGEKWLSDVRTVEVEEWLHSLPYAPATKSKIRNIMSAVFNHAIRHEWTHRNPISKVRASSKRLREPDVLTPAEFAALSDELPLRVKAMVVLAGSTGLRRSELVALTWRDVDPLLMQVAAGADLKTAQELLRHANSRITLDIYTRAISATKREANNKVMEMVIEAGKTRLSAPSRATTNLVTVP